MATKKTEAETPPAPPETTSNTFFAWLRSLGIRREPGWLGGVSAGLATRLNIDPLIVRGILVVMALLGGPALILYAAAWLFLPDVNNKIHLEQLSRGKIESPIAGIGVMVLLTMLPVAQGFWFAGSPFWDEPQWFPLITRVLWSLAVVALIVLFVVWIVRQVKLPTTPPPSTGEPEVDFATWRAQQATTKAETGAFRSRDAAEARSEEHERATAEAVRQRALRAEARRRTRSHPLFSFLVIGLALVAGGATTLVVGGGDLTDPALVAGLAVAVAVLGTGIIINGVMGKRAGGAAGLATLLIFPLIFFSLPDTPNLQVYSPGVIKPTDSNSNVPAYYAIATGDVWLDLRDYYPSPGPDEPNSLTDEVKLVVGTGNVKVYLPLYEYGTLTVQTGAGEVIREVIGFDGTSTNLGSTGSATTMTYGPRGTSKLSPSQRVLSVVIVVGVGDVTIIQPYTVQEYK